MILSSFVLCAHFLFCNVDCMTARNAAPVPFGERASWMSGRYGMAMHWLNCHYTGKPESVDGPAAGFNLESFMRQFDETGADWLLFTIGQNTGGYASPNATIERLCGPHHCAKRDLAGELAAALHARGKRFILYLPGDALVPSIGKGMKWDADGVRRFQFQTNWCGVIREWSERFGRNLDGWWFDGMGPGRYREGFDVDLWARAARAGNPDRALAFSTAMYRAIGKRTILGTHPSTAEDDYLGGELNFIENGAALCSFNRPFDTIRWLPKGPYAEGTRCLNHAFFPIDGFWGPWWPWPSLFDGTRWKWTHPDHFSQEAMEALRKRGEFPAPLYSRRELRSFVENFTGVGGAVTINVGVSADGRINPKSLELLRAIRHPECDLSWRDRPISEDGGIETFGRTVYAYAGNAFSLKGVDFEPMRDGLGKDFALGWKVSFTDSAYVPKECVGVDDGVRNLLSGGFYVDFKKTTVVPVTLSKLVPGRRYLVQLWMADLRATGRWRMAVVDDAADMAYNVDGHPLGTTAIGVFTADAEERTFHVLSETFQLNALQVREIDKTMHGGL